MGVTPRVGGARALLAATALAAVAAGAGACKPPENPKPPTVSLRMRGSPRDAAVIIDDQAIGQLDFVTARGVALPLGVHYVTVKAQGYLPWDRAVEAKEGAGPIVLDVALIPEPD
jgi:hypothetical protein